MAVCGAWCQAIARAVAGDGEGGSGDCVARAVAGDGEGGGR